MAKKSNNNDEDNYFLCWAWCKRHFNLSNEEIESLTPREFRLLQKLHREETKSMIELAGELVGSMHLMTYLVNTKKSDRKDLKAKDFMWFGFGKKKEKIDLMTKEGQEAFAAAAETMKGIKRK